jgi:hypothetical protein
VSGEVVILEEAAYCDQGMINVTSRARPMLFVTTSSADLLLCRCVASGGAGSCRSSSFHEHFRTFGHQHAARWEQSLFEDDQVKKAQR